MRFTDVVAGRRSVKLFDSGHEISDEVLRELFGQVILSPSSFNLQHWRFVVVRDQAVKAALRKVAFNQEQIETASAVVIVAAKLNAHEDAPYIFKDSPDAVRESMISMIDGFYAGKPQFQRDEAVRSASLAAMTLMLAAHDLGYASGPLIGFDPEGVAGVVKLDDQHVPVMLVVLGKQVGDIRPRAFRYPLSEVVKLESFSGAGLV